MCRVEYAESPTLCSAMDRKARKPHQCQECGRTIAPGETYRREEGLFEGSWFSQATCMHCMVAVRWLNRNCGGHVWQQVAEEIEEHAAEYPAIGAALRWTAALMRRGWAALDGAGLFPIPAPPAPIPGLVEVLEW